METGARAFSGIEPKEDLVQVIIDKHVPTRCRIRSFNKNT
jgi:hypothetical protein